MTNEILVELIQAGENTADNMQKLWEQNRGMIWKLAQQYRNKAEIEDLMQEGFIGLCNAVDAWQPDAGASFLHYAVFWISATRSQTVKSLRTSNGFPLFGELVV